MKLIYKNGPIEIYEVSEAWGLDYWVYGVLASGPRVCPSKGMAFEVAA